MNTTEHLQRIKAKCEFCLLEGRDNGIDKWTDLADAGWKTTIVAIDTLFACYPDGNIAARSLNAQHMAETIIAAWPEELL